MQFRPATLLFTVLAVVVAWAQEQPPASPVPPVLENAGKPMLLPFGCTQDDVQWAGLSCPADEPCPVYLELAAVESGVPPGPGRHDCPRHGASTQIRLYAKQARALGSGSQARNALQCSA